MLIAITQREQKLATVAKAGKFLVRGGDLFQRHLACQCGIVVAVVEIVELGDGFDQARLALHRFLQAQSVLLGSRHVQAENGQALTSRAARGHDQKQLVEMVGVVSLLAQQAFW